MRGNLGQRSIAMLAGAVVLAALTAGCFGDDRPVVETAPVSSGEVSQVVSAPARVDAAARQDVVAAVSGVVSSIEVSDGAAVEAGQVIVRLESAQVDAVREQAAAAESAAAGGAGIAVDGTGAATRRATQEAVAGLDEEVQPRLAEARARAAEISDDDQRSAALAAIEAVEAAYRSTRATLLTTGGAVAEQQDLAARSLSQALNDAIRQATAPQRAQAQAAAAAAERQADSLTLIAPFAGIVRLSEAAASDGSPLGAVELPPDLAGLAGSVGSVPGTGGGGTLRPGAPVSVGQPLFTVYDLSERYVNADVDEVDAPQVTAGQRAAVVVDALPDAQLEGIVESVDVESAPTEAGGVGYPTRIRLLADAATDDLRVGMTAGAEITTTTVDAELVVPSRALVRREGRTVVYVVRDGVVRQVPVRVDALGEDRAAVAGELTTDDVVVVAGYEELDDDVEVRAERTGG